MTKVNSYRMIQVNCF